MSHLVAFSASSHRLAKRTGAGVNDTTLAGDEGRGVNHRGRRHRRHVAVGGRSRSRIVAAARSSSRTSATGVATVVAAVVAAALRLAATLVANEDPVQQRAMALLFAAAGVAGVFAPASRAGDFATASRSRGSATTVATVVATAIATTLGLAAAVEIKQRLTAALLTTTRVAGVFAPASRAGGFAATGWVYDVHTAARGRCFAAAPFAAAGGFAAAIDP